MLDYVVTGLSANSVPYLEGLTLQRAVHRAVVEGQRPDTVILLQHEPVYTAGKRTSPEERPRSGDTPVIDVDRGGKITWHGPGQLVGYPIIRLAEPIDVVGYVRVLEGALIAALADLGIDGRRVEGRSGVWVGDRLDRKIAAIGIRVEAGVTMHGFALNCSNDLAAYDHIIACGIRDAGVTTVSRELGREVTPEDAMHAVRAHLDAALAPSATVAA